MRKGAGSLVVAAMSVWTMLPQELVAQERIKMSGQAASVGTEAGVGCSGGIIYDDGGFEDGYGMGLLADFVNYAMRFDLPSSSSRLDAICVPWASTFGASQIQFDLDVWAADGPGGLPGTLLGSVTGAQSTGITSSFKFFRYEIPGGLLLNTKTVWIGPSWQKNPFIFVGVDESLATPSRPGASYASSTSTQKFPPNKSITDIFPEYRALGIRIEAANVSGCQPSATAVCLSNDRFRIAATFETPNGGPSGVANLVKLTDDTGYLWFFSSTNVEAVVKVLNGCGLNNRYWVFAGGLTNVRTVITITDTETGTVKTYTNPQGTAFLPIQDTSAFATCP